MEEWHGGHYHLVWSLAAHIRPTIPLYDGEVIITEAIVIWRARLCKSLRIIMQIITHYYNDTMIIIWTL